MWMSVVTSMVNVAMNVKILLVPITVPVFLHSIWQKIDTGVNVSDISTMVFSYVFIGFRLDTYSFLDFAQSRYMELLMLFLSSIEMWWLDKVN